MRKILIIISAIILGLFSCEKPLEKGESGNPLITFYGDAYSDVGISISSAADGYVICGKLTVIQRSTNEAGQTYIESSSEDFGIIGIDKNGKQKWVLNLGGDSFDEARKVITLSDGSFVCVGTGTVTDNEFGTHRDVLITKISSSGVVLWETLAGGGGNQEANDVIETPQGEFIITGSTDISGKRDILFMKFSSLGEWVRGAKYGSGDDDDYGQKIIAKGGGEYLVMGTTEDADPGQGGTNIQLLIINSDLNNPEPHKYGSSSIEVGTDLIKIDGGYLITGNRISASGIPQGFMLKLSDSGTLEQPYTIKLLTAATPPLEINSLTAVGDGTYIAAGSTGTSQSGDMIFQFIDSDGNELATPGSFISGGTGYQSVKDVLIDTDGKVVAIGINSYETNSLITLLKFDPWGN